MLKNTLTKSYAHMLRNAEVKTPKISELRTDSGFSRWSQMVRGWGFEAAALEPDKTLHLKPKKVTKSYVSKSKNGR